MLTRRAFIEAAVAALGGSLIPFNVEALTNPLSISQMLTVGYPAVLRLLKNGREWVNPDLQKLYDTQRIVLRTLGTVVDYQNQQYDISEVSSILVWSEQDERDRDTEDKKCSLVATLIENGVIAHEHTLLHRVGVGQAVVSATYRHNLSETYRYERGSNGAIYYIASIYTAVAFLPARVET